MSLYNVGSRRTELIKRLRHELSLSKGLITDEELLEGMEGTFVFARIELEMAWSQLWKVLKLLILNRKGDLP